MKLLLDECISWRVGKYLSSLSNDILHVDNADLGDQPKDWKIYCFASENGYTILTKDDDFTGLALMSPSGPKVIRLMNANLDVRTLADRILNQEEAIKTFLDSKEVLLLVNLRP